MNRELLAKIIKMRRLDKGFSQRELAARIGCNVKTISEIESGTRQKPKIETLMKISDELIIEIDDLLDYAGYSDKELAKYFENNNYNLFNKNDIQEKNNEFFLKFLIKINGIRFNNSHKLEDDRLIEIQNNLNKVINILFEEIKKIEEYINDNK